jgi:hypothetical protein
MLCINVSETLEIKHFLIYGGSYFPKLEWQADYFFHWQNKFDKNQYCHVLKIILKKLDLWSMIEYSVDNFRLILFFYLI